MKIVPWLRYLLTLGLVYGVYCETGVNTAASIFLIFLYIELNAWVDRRAADREGGGKV